MSSISVSSAMAPGFGSVQVSSETAPGFGSVQVVVYGADVRYHELFSHYFYNPKEAEKATAIVLLEDSRLNTIIAVIKTKDDELFQLLVKSESYKNYNYFTRTKDGDNLLCIACQYGTKGMVDFCLDQGLWLDGLSSSSRAAYVEIINRGWADELNMLLKRVGAMGIRMTNQEFFKLFTQLTNTAHPEMVVTLLQHDVCRDIDLEAPFDHTTVLSEFAMVQQPIIFKQLLRMREAQPHTRTTPWTTHSGMLIFRAIWYSNNDEMIEDLLNTGVDPTLVHPGLQMPTDQCAYRAQRGRWLPGYGKKRGGKPIDDMTKEVVRINKLNIIGLDGKYAPTHFQVVIDIAGGFSCGFHRKMGEHVSLYSAEVDKNQAHSVLTNRQRKKITKAFYLSAEQPLCLTKIANRIRDGRVTIVTTGWKHHAIDFAFYKGYMAICNGGKCEQKYKIIEVWEIATPSITEDILLSILKPHNELWEFTKASKHFYEDIPTKINAKKGTPQTIFFESFQPPSIASSNCPYNSAEMGLFFVMGAMRIAKNLNHKLTDPNTAIQVKKAHEEAKSILVYSKVHRLKRFYAIISDDEKKQVAPKKGENFTNKGEVFFSSREIVLKRFSILNKDEMPKFMIDLQNEILALK